MTIHLETITVIGNFHISFNYPTLIDKWEDVVALAKAGVDPNGREIISFQIKGVDDCVRSYTPEMIRGMAHIGADVVMGGKNGSKTTLLYDKIIEWYLDEEGATLGSIDLDDFLELKDWLVLLDAHLQSPRGTLRSFVRALREQVGRIRELIDLVEDFTKETN